MRASLRRSPSPSLSRSAHPLLLQALARTRIKSGTSDVRSVVEAVEALAVATTGMIEVVTDAAVGIASTTAAPVAGMGIVRGGLVGRGGGGRRGGKRGGEGSGGREERRTCWGSTGAVGARRRWGGERAEHRQRQPGRILLSRPRLHCRWPYPRLCFVAHRQTR